MRHLLVLCLAVVSCVAHAEGHMRKTALPTPLDTYVAAPDSNYRYELVSKNEQEGWTSYTLHMVSQQWLTEAEVDKPLWEHYMTVCVPKEVKFNTAFMFIGGGGRDSKAPEIAGEIPRQLALNTGSIAVELSQIPNQPLTFTDDGRPRKEDDMIAYTWDKFLRTGDTKWPARLPMTKAVVRAMDTVQDFCKTQLPAPIEIKDFVVGGGSKRGWTTWTTAAVDTRVRAIVPIVIDMLNLVPSFRHHWQAYGGWAPAVAEYQEMKIFDRMETPEFAELMKIEEPYSYRERFTMPKLVMNAADDEFFLPDSQQFYWGELPGPKRLRCIPNAGHGLDGSDALYSVVGFYSCILTDTPLPDYHWTYPAGNSTSVTTASAPKAVKLWQATNPDARTFRLDQVGNKLWTETDIAPGADGAYVGTVATPDKGWTAFLVELTFDVPGPADLKFTTPVRVTPETMPYEYVPEANPIPGYLTTK